MSSGATITQQPTRPVDKPIAGNTGELSRLAERLFNYTSDQVLAIYSQVKRYYHQDGALDRTSRQAATNHPALNLVTHAPREVYIPGTNKLEKQLADQQRAGAAAVSGSNSCQQLAPLIPLLATLLDPMVLKKTGDPDLSAAYQQLKPIVALQREGLLSVG